MVALILAVLSALTPTIRAGSPGGCPLLTLSDLGSNLTFSTAGLVSSALTADGNPPVQIRDFNIVCLSTGIQRNTYSSASVVIRYGCESGQCRSGEMGLFFFSCSIDVWELGPPPDTNPLANLTTPLETSCSMCGVGETFSRVTFCNRKFCVCCDSSCLCLHFLLACATNRCTCKWDKVLFARIRILNFFAWVQRGSNFTWWPKMLPPSRGTVSA